MGKRSVTQLDFSCCGQGIRLLHYRELFFSLSTDVLCSNEGSGHRLALASKLMLLSPFHWRSVDACCCLLTTFSCPFSSCH